jgi:hypothetical protein
LIPPGAFQQSHWEVVCGGCLTLEQSGTQYNGRASNIWFMTLPPGSEYRCYEATYRSQFGGATHRYDPYAIEAYDGLRDADFAAAPITHVMVLDHPPALMDGEHLDVFLNKWTQRFAQAAVGTLQRVYGE